MTALWDRCQREDASLNEIVAAFEAEGDASELVAVARGENERSSALYVLAELPTIISRPVWRCALDYVADPDDRIAHYALDIFHSFLSEADADELLLVLRSINLERPVLFAKLFAIMLSVPADLLRRSRELAGHGRLAEEHSRGLALLARRAGTPTADIVSMLKGSNLVARFYGCCLVGRQHPRETSLRSLLPEPVKRRLALHDEG